MVQNFSLPGKLGFWPYPTRKFEAGLRLIQRNREIPWETTVDEVPADSRLCKAAAARAERPLPLKSSIRTCVSIAKAVYILGSDCRF